MQNEFIYFFVYYPRLEKEISSNISFIIPENERDWPQCIYYKESYNSNENNNFYYYKKIYKVKKNINTAYHFEFELDDDKYIITFNADNYNFIYNVQLETGKRIIHILYNIDQNVIEYNEKIDHFLSALEENGENDKIDLLYRNTIDLYEKVKGFGFLISLFLKLYQKKDLCKDLIKKFKIMNLSTEDKDKNIDRKSYLKDFSSKFEEITEKSEQIKNDNDYNTIEFYGIILCYLNYYDFKKFTSVVDLLYSKYPNDIFDILLIYYIHFKYPINKDFEFFNKFIEYTLIKKDFTSFKIGLSYIKDMENFLNVIDTNKKEIYNIFIKPIKDDKNKEKNNKNKEKDDKNKEKDNKKKEKDNKKKEKDNIEKYIIKLEKNKFFKKEEKKKGSEKYPIIIDYIKSIIKFSKDNNIFLIQFTSDFWNFILNCYEIIT